MSEAFIDVKIFYENDILTEWKANYSFALPELIIALERTKDFLNDSLTNLLSECKEASDKHNAEWPNFGSGEEDPEDQDAEKPDPLTSWLKGIINSDEQEVFEKNLKRKNVKINLSKRLKK